MAGTDGEEKYVVRITKPESGADVSQMALSGIKEVGDKRLNHLVLLREQLIQHCLRLFGSYAKHALLLGLFDEQKFDKLVIGFIGNLLIQKL